MLGFFQRRTAQEEAESAKELMDSQLAAAKLLGKSVDDIAQSVKQLFGRDDFKASFARMGEDAAETLRKTFQQFEGAELGDDMMAGLAKAFTDPIMTQSEEARQSLSALRLIDPQAADEIQRNIQGFRDATAAGDTDAAEKFAKEAERLTLQTTAQIANMSEQDKRRLELQGQSNAALAGTLANQNAIKEAFANYGKEQDITLNEAARTSTMFDNIITLLSNSFGALYTSVQAGIAPALETFTKAFGEASDPNSAIAQFQVKLGAISEKISASFNRIFGDSEKLGGEGGAIPLVNGLLDTLASVIESTADNILGFVDSLMADDGTSFMDKIGKFVGDMFGDLLGIIADQIKAIDFMELIFGESNQEIVDNTSDQVSKIREQNERMGGSEEYKAEILQGQLDASVGSIVERAEDKGFDAEKTLQMIEDAGIKVTELSGERLQEIFPDPEELKSAIAGVYGNDIESAQTAWAEASGKIAKMTDEQLRATGEFGDKVKRAFESDEETSARIREAAVTASAWMSASESDITDTIMTEQRNLPTEGIVKEDTPVGTDLPTDGIVKEDTPLGTPPAQASSTSVITDPETAEPTTPGPVSHDGTPTQEVKPAVSKETDQDTANKTLEDLLLMQMNILSDIKKNTGKTVSGIGSLRTEI